MKPTKTPRIAAAAVLVACMLVAVAALGGVGHAQNVISSAQGAYGKVTICHKGKNTISISKSAWPAHQRHGDTLGTCAAAKKAKAAKAKAAKIKAAKIKAAKAKAAKAKAEQAKAEKGKSEEKKNDHADKPGKGGGKGKGGKG